MNEVTDKPAARKVALDLLARREHSALELRRKLLARGYDDDDIDAALAGLQQERLQSDERFAEAYVHSRVEAGMGPLRIRHELRERGVGEGPIEAALGPLADRWDEMMAALRERRYGAEVPQDYAARMKQARFLQNRGFSADSVMRLFR